MQFTTLLFASLATLAVGQSATSSAASSVQTSTCAAQNVLDACVASTKAAINNCMTTDYDCLCAAYGVVLICYNNCPSDPGAFGAQQNRDQFCNAASAYGIKTSTSLAAAAATSASTSSASTGTTTRSSTTATATSHNSAAGLKVGSGMLAVAFAGLWLV